MDVDPLTSPEPEPKPDYYDEGFDAKVWRKVIATPDNIA